jgi:hypothetical protein
VISLRLADNGIGDLGAELLALALIGKTQLKVLDISNNMIGGEGADHLTSMVQNNESLVCLNVLGNQFLLSQIQELIGFMATNKTLTTLCGIHGDETELDLSNRRLSSSCVLVLAKELLHHQCLASLSLSLNSGKGKAKLGNPAQSTLMHVVQAAGSPTIWVPNFVGIEALCVVIAENRLALKVLDLSFNDLGREGFELIASALKKNTLLSEFIFSSAGKHIKLHDATEDINCGGFSLGQAGVKLVVAFAQRCKSLIAMNVASNRLVTSTWSNIKQISIPDYSGVGCLCGLMSSTDQTI